jgi:hypothetical protein
MKNSKIVIATTLLATILSGCDLLGTQAERVSQNLSQEADSFNVVRQLTVINCIKGDVIFQMTGKMSITLDPNKPKLDIIVEDEDGRYQKHFVGLSDNVTYTIQQLKFKDVSNYKYTINFNPSMWLPVDVKTVK